MLGQTCNTAPHLKASGSPDGLSRCTRGGGPGAALGGPLASIISASDPQTGSPSTPCARRQPRVASASSHRGAGQGSLHASSGWSSLCPDPPHYPVLLPETEFRMETQPSFHPAAPSHPHMLLGKKKKNPRTTAKGPWDKGPKMALRDVQGLERPQITLKCRQFFTTHELSYRKFYPSPPGRLSREQRAFLGVRSRVLAAVEPLMVGERTSTKHLP